MAPPHKNFSAMCDTLESHRRACLNRIRTALRNLKIDICKIAVIVFGDERRHSLFDRTSKAACLRVGARVVAIESDRFSTGR
jgi:hypothetical protein